MITYFATLLNGNADTKFTLQLADSALWITNTSHTAHTEKIPYKDVQFQFEKSTGNTIIQVPSKTLIITDADATKDLQRKKLHREKNVVARTFSGSRGKVLAVLGILLLLLGLLYYLLVPYISESMATKLPKQYEIDLGNKIFTATVDTTKKDTQKSILLNQFFTTLAIPTPYLIRITVINDATINAFAVLGGNIVVYTGLLNKLTTPEALAALLCHEFTHIELQHTTKSICRSLGRSLFFSLLVGNTNGVSDIVLNNAKRFSGLHYSRRLEKEADLNGLKLLADRKIYTSGFVTLMEVLKKASIAQAPIELWSSHPNIDERISYIKKSPHYNNVVQTNATYLQLQQLFNDLQSSKNDF